MHKDVNEKKKVTAYIERVISDIFTYIERLIRNRDISTCIERLQINRKICTYIES